MQENQREAAQPSDLKLLEGQECWGIIAGAGAGSMIDLMIGRKIPRESPLPNDKLSRELRENDAEFCACLFYCSWRLYSAEGIICSAMWSSNVAGGPMLEGLSRITNQRIKSIDMTPDTCDLTIRFENGLTLDVFNDYPSQTDDTSSFWIDTPDASYGVRGFEFEKMVNE